MAKSAPAFSSSDEPPARRRPASIAFTRPSPAVIVVVLIDRSVTPWRTHGLAPERTMITFAARSSDGVWAAIDMNCWIWSAGTCSLITTASTAGSRALSPTAALALVPPATAKVFFRSDSIALRACSLGASTTTPPAPVCETASASS